MCIELAIKTIVVINGIEILTDTNRFFSYLDDVVPQLAYERNVIRKTYNKYFASAIVKAIYSDLNDSKKILLKLEKNISINNGATMAAEVIKYFRPLIRESALDIEKEHKLYKEYINQNRFIYGKNGLNRPSIILKTNDVSKKKTTVIPLDLEVFIKENQPNKVSNKNKEFNKVDRKVNKKGKKGFKVLLVLLLGLVLSVISIVNITSLFRNLLIHDHVYRAATCDEPKTCKYCGKTKGEALGHSYSKATCEQASVCTECGKKKGTKLGHLWDGAICSRCGETNPSYESFDDHSFNSEKTTETTYYTDSITSDPSVGNGKFVNFDDPSFFVNGKKYTLGKTTLQEMINDGVPFESINTASNNVDKNHYVSFKIKLDDEYWTATIEVMNDTDAGIKASECYVSSISFRNQTDKTQNIISFNFPLNCTPDQVMAVEGKPEGSNYYYNDEDPNWVACYLTYSKKTSTKYYNQSRYEFDFYNNILHTVYISYIR